MMKNYRQAAVPARKAPGRQAAITLIISIAAFLTGFFVIGGVLGIIAIIRAAAMLISQKRQNDAENPFRRRCVVSIIFGGFAVMAAVISLFMGSFINGMITPDDNFNAGAVTGNTYENSAYALRISFPDGWELSPAYLGDEFSDTIFRAASDSGGKVELIQLRTGMLSRYMVTTDVKVQTVLEQKGFSLGSTDRLQGSRAAYTIYKCTDEAGNEMNIYFCTNNKYIMYLSCFSPAGTDEALKPIVSITD
ncbi:MAG: hypothetical protein ACI4DP_06450 [Candidatus Ornithomonoglobus sp.]